MPRPTRRLTQNDIKNLRYTVPGMAHPATGKTTWPKQVLWDLHPVGFGVRVFPSGRKSFVYKYRNSEGQQRFAELGAVGELTLDQARDKAQKWAAMVLDGKDPLDEKHKARSGALMSELCEAYITRHAKPKKQSWKEDERRNKLYIIPALGSRQVQFIKRLDVSQLHHEIGIIQNKPYMANRVREQLSKMFELAKEWGFVDEDSTNPAKGITDFEEHERQAYIKPEHMSIVAKAIEGEQNEAAKCAIWFYLLTGKRKNEVLKAKWQDIDDEAGTLKIVDTKNGESEYLPLGADAIGILERAAKLRTIGNPYIFPGDKPRSHLVNIRKPWLRIREEAARNGAEGIESVTIHGLRHTVGVWLTNHADADLGLVRKIFNHKSLLATKVYAKYKTQTVKVALEQHGKRLMEFAKAENADKKVVKN